MLRTGTLSSLLVLIVAGHVLAQPPPSDQVGAPSPGTASRATALEVLTTLRGSAGWRDNVLLSPFAPMQRTFGRAEAEIFMYYPLAEALELVSFLSADVLRYISPPAETDGEQLWFGRGEARWTASDRVRVTLKADGFIEDTVIDLSETEAVRLVAPTRVQGGFVTGAVRLHLPGGFVAEPLVQARRMDYREFPGDFDAMKAGGRLEWKRGDALVLAANWAEHRRRYAARNQYSASGRPVPGTRLRFTQRDAEIRADTRWRASGQWHVGAAAGRFKNRDQSSGFFDYDQKRARLTMDWQSGPWLVLVEGEARRTDYLHQTVGAGMAPPARIADFYEARLRVERQTDSGWTFFAEERWERNRSNEFSFSYRANTVLAGVQRDL